MRASLGLLRDFHRKEGGRFPRLVHITWLRSYEKLGDATLSVDLDGLGKHRTLVTLKLHGLWADSKWYSGDGATEVGGHTSQAFSKGIKINTASENSDALNMSILILITPRKDGVSVSRGWSKFKVLSLTAC